MNEDKALLILGIVAIIFMISGFGLICYISMNLGTSVKEAENILEQYCLELKENLEDKGYIVIEGTLDNSNFEKKVRVFGNLENILNILYKTNTNEVYLTWYSLKLCGGYTLSFSYNGTYYRYTDWWI